MESSGCFTKPDSYKTMPRRCSSSYLYKCNDRCLSSTYENVAEVGSYPCEAFESDVLPGGGTLGLRRTNSEFSESGTLCIF